MDKRERLQKLYGIKKQMEEMGIPLPKELRFEIEQLENEINSSEIVEELKYWLEQKLRDCPIPLDFFISFKPGQDLEINVKNVKKVVERKLKQPPEPAKVLILTLQNGEIIRKRSNVETFVEFIKKIGVERALEAVKDCNIVSDGDLIIGKNFKSENASPKYLENGYFLNVHSSSREKKRQIEIIVSYLNLDVKIEIV